MFAAAGPPMTFLTFRQHFTAISNKKNSSCQWFRKTFLNVEIIPNQRGLLRFFGYNNLYWGANSEIQSFGGVFGLVSSPFILNATIRKHLSKYGKDDTQFVDDVLNSLYVDDYTLKKNSVSDGFEQVFPKRRFKYEKMSLKRWRLKWKNWRVVT